jgi:hypothetical protein
MTSKELKELTATKLEQQLEKDDVLGSKKDKTQHDDDNDNNEDKSAADASMSGSDVPVDDAAAENEEEEDNDSSPKAVVPGATAKVASASASASSGAKTVKSKPAPTGDKRGVKKAVTKPVVAKHKATEENANDDDDDDDVNNDGSDVDMKNSKGNKKTKNKPKDDEEEENDDDDDDDDDEDDDDSEKHAKKGTALKKDDTKPVVRVGGPIETKAFALLDGIFEDPDTGTQTRVTIPITRIPATLGRTHDTEDTHFFGLGKKKALSRRQCRIYYRDAKGGRVGQWNEESQEMTYKTPADVLKEEGDDANNPDKLMDAGGGKGVAEGKVSSSGFYVIEGLGKNRIMVHGTRVDQGHSAVLISGSPIRISSYMLYFLQPTDAMPKYKFLPNSEEAALVEGDDKDKTTVSKGRSSGGKDKDDGMSKKKKRKTPTLVPSSVVSSSSPSVVGSSKGGGGGSKDDGPAMKKIKTDKGGQTFQAELDDLPVETLLEKMSDAISKNEWERKHQLIGSTISLHAVRYAAMDPKIQILAMDGGVSRTNIMSWIEHSDLFKEWVEQMLSKMEARSYQAAVTKSLLKTGFTRTGSSGRYIKWLLPKDIKITVKAPAKSNKSDLKKMGGNALGGKKLKTASTAGEEDENEEEEDEGGEERGEKENGDDDEEEEEGGEEEGDEEVGDEEEEDDDDDEDKAKGKRGSENDEDSGESDNSDDDKLGKTKKAFDDDEEEEEEEDDDDDDSGNDLERTIVRDKTKEEDDDDDDDDDESV